jgi:hypothetical protein
MLRPNHPQLQPSGPAAAGTHAVAQLFLHERLHDRKQNVEETGLVDDANAVDACGEVVLSVRRDSEEGGEAPVQR